VRLEPLPGETPWDALQRQRKAALRARAMEAVRQAEAAAAAHGGRILVFGSLLGPLFDEGSDIDLGVEGPEAAAQAAWVAVTRAGFECDVVNLGDATGSLLERIRRDGREPGALG
jgi:predicted nucleotidyltransferase